MQPPADSIDCSLAGHLGFSLAGSRDFGACWLAAGTFNLSLGLSIIIFQQGDSSTLSFGFVILMTKIKVVDTVTVGAACQTRADKQKFSCFPS